MLELPQGFRTGSSTMDGINAVINLTEKKKTVASVGKHRCPLTLTQFLINNNGYNPFYIVLDMTILLFNPTVYVPKSEWLELSII